MDTRNVNIWQQQQKKYQYIYIVDDLWKHYAKSKKPITKDHMLYDPIYFKCPGQANAQSRFEVA